MSKLIQSFHILLVSPHTSHRAGLRKTLCDMGAENRFVEVAGDFARAKERLTKTPVNMLITDDELSETESGLELLDLHLKNNPNSRNRIFILMTSQTTPFLMADFALKGGDCIINKPFRNETLISSVSNILKEKENIRVEDGLILDVQDAIRVNDHDRAREVLETFKNPTCLEANYAKAIVHEASDELDQAFEFFAKVLSEKPNFKSLVSILKVGMASKKYFELAEYMEIWMKSYPIHHQSIPDMTKAIVINNKYALLDELFQLFTQHRIEDKFAKTSLGAGFVIAALCCLESGDKDKTKIYALKGIEYSCRRFPIISRALEILNEIGEGAAGEKAYFKFCSHETTPETKILDLKVMDMTQPKIKVLAECQKLLNEKIIDPDLYRITIKCLKATGKSPDEMIALARKNFPDLSFNTESLKN